MFSLVKLCSTEFRAALIGLQCLQQIQDKFLLALGMVRYHAQLCPCSPPPCSLSKQPIQDSVGVSFEEQRFQCVVFDIARTLLFDCVNASNVNKHPLYSNRH